MKSVFSLSISFAYHWNKTLFKKEEEEEEEHPQTVKFVS